MNPFATHRRLLSGYNTTARHFHERAAVLAGQQTERSQRLHVEPAVGRNSQARLKCADGKLQIRAEDPVADTFTAETFEVEAPVGIHIEPEPIAAPEDEVSHTLTMADLYSRQGLTDDARHIYESILQRDPDNAAVREKLEALNPPSAPVASSPRDAKVARLESWLTKVGRREESHV